MRHYGEVRVARGCWLPAEQAESFAARCVAALETCADDTMISDTTAARLYNLWLPYRSEEIQLTTAQPDRASRCMTRTQRPEFRAHRRRLHEDDRADLNGIPVTSLARTWVDLAPVLSLADLVAAGDSALRAGCTVDEMVATMQRSGRLRGVRRVREALPMLDRRSRSRPESHLRVAVWVPDLPRFEVNEPVYRSDGGWLAEPDLSLAEARLALEYQGEDHAALERMRKDLTRGKDMRDDEWLSLPYGPAEVFKRPWQIAPEVRKYVRERAPHLLGRRSRPTR